jgi:hypothetical protein
MAQRLVSGLILMAFVGQVQRLGVGSPSLLPAALFIFDDVLLIPNVRPGVTLGAGYRSSKKEQDAIKALSELDDLSPQLVLERWPKARSFPVADIDKAHLGRSAQGAMYGTLELQISCQDGRNILLLAHRTTRDSLLRMLQSVLGNRFQTTLHPKGPSEALADG